MTVHKMNRMIAVLAVVTMARADTLLQQGYFAPGSAADPAKGISRTHIRFHTEALVHADNAGEIRLVARCVKIGRYKTPLTLKFLPLGDQAAKPETHTVLAGEVAEIILKTRPGAVHRLIADAGRNAYTLECLSGGRLAFPAEIGGTSFHGIRKAAPIYFFVPKGARQFKVKLEGEGVGEIVSARIFTPDGTVVATFDTIGVFERIVTVSVPAGMDGAVWKAEPARVPGKLFEDFAISFDGDVVPYVSESPSGILAPLFGVRTPAIAWQIGRDAAPKVTVRLYSQLSEIDLRLKFSVRNGDGAMVQEKMVPTAGKRDIVLALEGPLAPGEYAWSVSAIDAEGKALLSRDGIWVLVPRPKQMTAKDGLLCNGKPFFPRGLYHVAPEDYALVAAHGFNCVQTTAGVPPVRKRSQSWVNGSVELAAAAGLKSCVALYWSGRPNGSEWRRQFQGVLKHPGVLAWMIQDEPDGQFVSLELMARSYAYIRANDPERPAYTCLCRPQMYGRYGSQTDYMSLDVYPIGRSPITQIAKSLERAQNVVPNVPFWFIGQIWPWRGKPNVTPAQHRCMTYLALTHGARGL
ncbi:MAG: hypothetical protein KAI66_19225, partial [Lentisphaeria bacterium]|nr:hypothetical protein [Lentisphaeria bacterium]